MGVSVTLNREKEALAALEVSSARREGRILLKKHVIYRLSDKGRRILESCEGLSDGEAESFLGLSPRQLDVLRRLKNGPKRVVDFPYDAKYNLKRMVERGLIIKTVVGLMLRCLSA
mgnify:CR=1 FL=1